jgi:radical SAM superfamily enzyme YgiQ (UPF0313 family)
MSKVLLGQSYILRFDPKLWEAKQPYPPLGTLYAASYLQKKGYDVALFDAVLAKSEADWADALDREQPHFAVIYEDNFNYLSKMCLLRMRHAALVMIDMARARGCTVIVGGSDATDHADIYLARGADYVLIGEGEQTLGDLLDRLAGRSELPFDQIQGLAFREEEAKDKSPHCTPRRPYLDDLDGLPFPAWDLVDIPRYARIWRRRHGYYSMNIVTTRGCPYHCNWCAKPIWGQHYSVRSPENVIEELGQLRARYGPDHIWFVDDIFGLERGWCSRFAELVQAQNVRLPFKCLSRADLLLREGEIEALQRAGCQIVWLGAESGSQKILDAMEKGTTVAQIYQTASRLHAAGIQVGFFIQFGYPGETRQDIEATMQMIRDCAPNDIGVSVTYPLPGTPLYAHVQEQLGARRNWTDSMDLAMLYHGPFRTAFYRQLHKVLHKEFRARIHWAALREAAALSARLNRSHLRRAASLVYHGLTLPWARWRLNWLGRKPSPDAMTPPPRRDHRAEVNPSTGPIENRERFQCQS